MGADFVFAITEYIEDPDTVKARIPYLSNERLHDVADTVWGESPDDLNEVRELLMEAVDIASGTCQHRRDIGTFVAEGGTTYVLSGGMTWGDDPTDACRYLWALEVSGLT